MRIFYLIGSRLYVLAVHIAALWNPKAKKWVDGRKETFEKIERWLQVIQRGEKQGRPVYWFHCASLGEFEQGRPLMEALKAREHCSIVITFFSSSGYEVRKNYELADLIVYLPVDSKKKARRFFDLVKPAAAFFIKYEFWAGYIFEAQKRNISLYSVSAVFRKNQVFFKWYGGYMRKVLHAVKTIFVQDENSKKLLESIGISSIISGDTRYDRVMANAQKAQRFPVIDKFTEDHKIFILGSIWSQDLAAITIPLAELCERNKAWKIIIAPHEISEAYISSVEQEFFKGAVRFSKLNDENNNAQVLIIDNIGMLMNLYGYAHLAYVGGAFKTGLHNILEPASFGLPVIFGPHHQKFPEAQLFIDNGIGFSISNGSEFASILDKMLNEDYRERVLNFMNSRRGATELILSNL